MTALADIAKAHPSLHGDSLRGSDLVQFNIQHKRDAQGRFAAIAAAPAQADPRAARQARRLRRVRRQVKGAAVQANAAAAVQVAQAKEAKSDPRALQAIQRRVLPIKAQARVQAKPEKAKIGLNDKEYLKEAEESSAFGEPAYLLMDREHAEEVLQARSALIGAANAKWGTHLAVFSWGGLKEHVKTNDPTDKVVLSLGEYALVTEVGATPGSYSLASNQYIAPNEVSGKTGVQFRKEPMELTHKGNPVKVPQVGAGAYVAPIAPSLLPRDQYPNVHKADETWDEDEHKRDPRTGRFAALAATAAGVPAVVEIDPRVARAQRRQRRVRRATAAVAAAPVQEVAEEKQTQRARQSMTRERILEHKRQERLTARRTQAKPQGKPEGKPQAEPRAEPKARPRPPRIAPNFEPLFPLEGEALYMGEKYGRAPRDPRARLRPENVEDIGRVWIDPDTGNPKFRPEMSVRQVPKQYQQAFLRYQRAQARKQSGETP
jgi:hypothetical protein